MEMIDARGKPCPQPVVLVKKAIEQGASKLEILVDNAVSASNVKRFLESQGFSVTEELHGADFVIRGLGSPSASPSARTEKAQGAEKGYAVFLQKSVLGFPDEVLGEGLMKAFLSNLAEREEAPLVVALMNGAVLLALEDTSTCESLRKLEGKGVSILVCGTCTKHFGVTEKVGVGCISNMMEITDALLAAPKVLTIA
ncbi:MAG: sulfurtransferase-like selenium metabolism protein YedF [Synergistaceae bacterium]|jgi:selenium metabolism protein YedF|nr:sulfurtransferase-like selenium metabolism protein YedF [Synergistaceae bacterium]